MWNSYGMIKTTTAAQLNLGNQNCLLNLPVQPLMRLAETAEQTNVIVILYGNYVNSRGL